MFCLSVCLRNLDSSAFKFRTLYGRKCCIDHLINPDFKIFFKFQITQTLTETTASLTIRKAEEEDVGNYTIKLKNNCGEASAELTLILMGMFAYSQNICFTVWTIVFFYHLIFAHFL